jgi:hypothetical protein
MGTQEWILSLEGLSDEPMRRAAQIALAALRLLDIDGVPMHELVPLVAAYEALQEALSDKCRPSKDSARFFLEQHVSKSEAKES